jgi:hypothetical protein
MCFLFSLIPATFWVVVGFFVLFASTRAEGTQHKFGRVLGVWVLIVALFFPICGAYVTLSGKCPIEKMMQQWESPIETQP